MTAPNSPEQKLIEALDSVDTLLAYADYRPDASTRHQLAIARSIALSLLAELSEFREYKALADIAEQAWRLLDLFEPNHHVTKSLDTALTALPDRAKKIQAVLQAASDWEVADENVDPMTLEHNLIKAVRDLDKETP